MLTKKKQILLKNKLMFIFLLATLTFTIIETIVLLINPIDYVIVSPFFILFSFIYIIAILILKFIFKKNTNHIFIMIISLTIQIVSLVSFISYTYLLTTLPGYFVNIELINPLVIKISQIYRDLYTNEILSTKDFFSPYLNILNVLGCFALFFLLNKPKKSQEITKSKLHLSDFVKETVVLITHPLMFLILSISEIIFIHNDSSIYYSYGYYSIIISSIYLLILLIFYKKIALNRKLLVICVLFLLISQIISYIPYSISNYLLDTQGGAYSINTSFVFPCIIKITYKTWSYETLTGGTSTLYLPYLCLIVALSEIVIIFIKNKRHKKEN